MLNRLRLLFAKGTQGVGGGVEEIGVGFQQWCVAGLQARKEDHVRSVARGHAILRPGEPAIHLRCPEICRWWIYNRPADEGSRGGIGNVPWMGLGDGSLETDVQLPCVANDCQCRLRASTRGGWLWPIPTRVAWQLILQQTMR